MNSNPTDKFALQKAWNTRESFSQPIRRILLPMLWTAMPTMFATNAQKHITEERLVVMPKWATDTIHRNWFAAVAAT